MYKWKNYPLVFNGWVRREPAKMGFHLQDLKCYGDVIYRWGFAMSLLNTPDF